MQAIKAIYDKGRIELLSPIEGVDHAELYILVLDDNQKDDKQKRELSVQQFIPKTTTSEQEFKALGLKAFFDTEDDADVDWEEVFDVKDR